MTESITEITANNMPLDDLADYIVNKHHHYIANNVPLIVEHLQELVSLHGSKYPQLAEITMLFQACASALALHTQKEEVILFPFIKKIVVAKEQQLPLPPMPFGTVNNPINMMMHEHDDELARFKRIRLLASDYSAPTDMGDIGQLAFTLLNEFEEDLHTHIQLENNILFPKAIELEQQFS